MARQEFLDKDGLTKFWKVVKENTTPLTHTTQKATVNTLGHIKVDSYLSSVLSSRTIPTTTPPSSITIQSPLFGLNNKYYPVGITSDGYAFVNIPWENTTYSPATTTTNGLMSSVDKNKLTNVYDGCVSAGAYVIKIEDDNFDSTIYDLKILDGYKDVNWKAHYQGLCKAFDNNALPEFIRLELVHTDGEIMSTHVFFLLEGFRDSAVYRCNRWTSTITITFSEFSITCGS